MPEGPTSVFQNLTASRLFTVLLIVLACWILIRYVSHILHALGARSSRARFAIRWLEPVLRIGLWFLAIFLSLELLAPTEETFLAGIGSAAIAIGLGAQDLIKNLSGGLVVLADRPYQLGDRVKIGEAYGEIDHIGLRSTKLTTPFDTRVTIPNSIVMSSEVYNANSGVPDSLVVTDVYLPPSTDPAAARRIGYDAAFTCPYVLPEKPVTVLVTSEFNQERALRLRIAAHVHDHRYEPRMMSDITERALEEFRNRGMLDREPAGAP